MHKRRVHASKRARHTKNPTAPAFKVGAKSDRYTLITKFKTLTSFRGFTTVEAARRFAVKRVARKVETIIGWRVKDTAKNLIVWSNAL